MWKYQMINFIEEILKYKIEIIQNLILLQHSIAK